MNRIKEYINAFVGFVLPVMALTSCLDTVELRKDEVVPREFPVSLSVHQPYEGTRISVDGTSVAWEEDDNLQITAVDAEGNTGTSELTWFEGIDGKDGHYASFSGFVTMTSVPVDCYFVHPYKSATKVDAKTGRITLYYNNQTGLHEPFMYSKTAYDENGISTKLNHVGAMLEIQVNIDGVSQLTFAGNRLEGLSPVIVDAVTGEISFTNEANVQITVPVRSEGKTYIAVPPVNLEKGFSIICSNADASKSMIRTFSSDGNFSSGYDFSTKVGQIIPITLSGSLESYSVTSSDPVVAHTKNASGLLTGTSVSFSMNKTGASDKIIEEWGATLVNAAGTVVREAKYSNASPMSGASVTMSIANNWKLLPAGTYTFTPYYMIYGRKFSMDSYVRKVTVPDPGVSLVIGGQTSYDKYKAGNVSGANSHANTLIEGVKVSTNLDLSIIDSYSATLDGADLGAGTISSGTSVVASYGNLTRTQYKAYSCKTVITVGPVTFTAEHDFHITGLPYEGNFSSDPSNSSVWIPNWSYLGIAAYSNKWVTFKKGSGGLKSPAFHVPASFNVQTSIDAHTNCSNTSDREIHITSCTSSQGQAITSSVKTYRPNYKGVLANSLSSQGYSSWIDGFTLTSDKKHMLYSVLIDDESWLFLNQTRVGIFKIKIHYK